MPGIFISYRREDSAASAGRLYDWISNRFGKNRIFIDVDTIPPGTDFIKLVQETIKTCDVLIAVIGKAWLTCVDEGGARRLNSPADLVRAEIATALRRNIRVIPILVDGARMPPADSLPAALTKLVRLNGLTLSHDRFRDDVERLFAILQTVVGTDSKTRGAERPPAARTTRQVAKKVALASPPRTIKSEAVKTRSEMNPPKGPVASVPRTPPQKNPATAPKDKDLRFYDHYVAGQSCYEMGDFAGAIVAYRRALRIKPDPGIYINLAFALEKERKFHGAIAAYKKVLQIDPDYAVAQTSLNQLMRKVGPAAFKSFTGGNPSQSAQDSENSWRSLLPGFLRRKDS